MSKLICNFHCGVFHAFGHEATNMVSNKPYRNRVKAFELAPTKTTLCALWPVLCPTKMLIQTRHLSESWYLFFIQLCGVTHWKFIGENNWLLQLHQMGSKTHRLSLEQSDSKLIFSAFCGILFLSFPSPAQMKYHRSNGVASQVNYILEKKRRIYTSPPLCLIECCNFPKKQSDAEKID